VFTTPIKGGLWPSLFPLLMGLMYIYTHKGSMEKSGFATTLVSFSLCSYSNTFYSWTVHDAAKICTYRNSNLDLRGQQQKDHLLKSRCAHKSSTTNCYDHQLSKHVHRSSTGQASHHLKDKIIGYLEFPIIRPTLFRI